MTGEFSWLAFDDVLHGEWSTNDGTEQDPCYKIEEPGFSGGNVSSDVQSNMQIRIGGI